MNDVAARKKLRRILELGSETETAIAEWHEIPLSGPPSTPQLDVVRDFLSGSSSMEEMPKLLTRLFDSVTYNDQRYDTEQGGIGWKTDPSRAKVMQIVKLMYYTYPGAVSEALKEVYRNASSIYDNQRLVKFIGVCSRLPDRIPKPTSS